MKKFFNQDTSARLKTDNVARFIKHNFRHFNAAALVDAAEGYRELIDEGGCMLMVLAGAMSTAELGLSLAEMIRNDKIHGLCCTGANLEEDIFNLVAHDHYRRIPGYRDLTPAEEEDLLKNHLNRVTDTCIPEEEAIRRIEHEILDLWKDADKKGQRYFPHEFIYRLLQSERLSPLYQIDPKDSWVLAACEKRLPIFVPGWEDSTLGNVYASHCLRKHISNVHTVKSGIEYMMFLSDWYRKTAGSKAVGFFQIGGGIAGDFPICVVPMLRQDMGLTETPLWKYFCQISDSTTSYGSYSGAVPNEKITWEKLDVDTPKYVIESDATIVAPLIFAYVLENNLS
ncbi:MAG: deoxyhypusine synthase family protein [Syntrophales bacterium]|jgi:deoxyhypusine synthase|nr:deoxyhypusine synthase family protein [Syntrophales bacterium]MDY0044101.1 deoxyhypusine synthase family protein [Syntrophales bacterium]